MNHRHLLYYSRRRRLDDHQRLLRLTVYRLLLHSLQLLGLDLNNLHRLMVSLLRLLRHGLDCRNRLRCRLGHSLDSGCLLTSLRPLALVTFEIRGTRERGGTRSARERLHALVDGHVMCFQMLFPRRIPAADIALVWSDFLVYEQHVAFEVVFSAETGVANVTLELPNVKVDPFHMLFHRAVLVGDVGTILTFNIRLLVDLFNVTQQLCSTVVGLAAMVADKLLFLFMIRHVGHVEMLGQRRERAVLAFVTGLRLED